MPRKKSDTAATVLAACREFLDVIDTAALPRNQYAWASGFARPARLLMAKIDALVGAPHIDPPHTAHATDCCRACCRRKGPCAQRREAERANPER